MSVTLTPQQDRILKRLERKYDKDAAPTRDYFTDLREIDSLLKAQVIDKDHADLLAMRAKAVYKERERKRKEANQPKEPQQPLPVHIRNRGRVSLGLRTNARTINKEVGALINGLIGLAAMLIVVAILLA